MHHPHQHVVWELSCINWSCDFAGVLEVMVQEHCQVPCCPYYTGATLICYNSWLVDQEWAVGLPLVSVCKP